MHIEVYTAETEAKQTESFQAPSNIRITQSSVQETIGYDKF